MAVRAVIYARYSSENQRAASIADQVELCRRYAERHHWTIAAVYDDAAISGASSRRPGFQRLLADVEAGRIDVVICEAIDRLGRKLADVANFHDQLTFARAELHAVNIGLVTAMHVGIMGTMAQMTLTDLRDKVRRGQLGRVRAGRIPGGLAYGYAVVPPPPGADAGGERCIVPHEATIVRRIFTDYAAGLSARRIAARLNAEHIPGPGGRPWNDTTIRGQIDRGTGLLNNSVHVGLLRWNRCSYVKDPRTGDRVARVNPPEQREEVPVPELRIVDDELWQRVKARQQEVRIEMRDPAGNALNRAHRPHFLLSGILRCGCCGGRYNIMGRDRYGCATQRARGTCSNKVTIRRQAIEARVLGALREHLLTPALVEAFVRGYAEELARLQREATSHRADAEHELAAVERSLRGVLRAIEAGAWSDTLHTRLNELEARKKALQADIAAPAPRPVALHPNAAALYAAKVADLQAALNAPDLRDAAAETLRGLIACVVLTPDPAAPDGLAAELHGELAMVLALAGDAADGEVDARRPVKSRAERPGTGVGMRQLSVVAGAGFEPATFRL